MGDVESTQKRIFSELERAAKPPWEVRGINSEQGHSRSINRRVKKPTFTKRHHHTNCRVLNLGTHEKRVTLDQGTYHRIIRKGAKRWQNKEG